MLDCQPDNYVPATKEGRWPRSQVQVTFRYSTIREKHHTVVRYRNSIKGLQIKGENLQQHYYTYCLKHCFLVKLSSLSSVGRLDYIGNFYNNMQLFVLLFVTYLIIYY